MKYTDPSLQGFIPTEYFYPDRKDKTLAIIALGVSMFSLVTFGFLGVGTLAGLLLGIISLIKIRIEPTRFAGHGFAIAAVILSLLSGILFSSVVYFMAQNIAQPAEMDHAEETAISRMRGIARSEETFRHFVSNGTFGTLEELRAKGLIDHDETKDGYTFAVTLQGKSFEAYGVPNQYGWTGRRSFYVTTDG